MVKKYRGDTFIFNLSFEDEEMTFKPNDILRLGAKRTCDCCTYLLTKELVIAEDSTEAEIIFDAEETKDLAIGDYLLEVEFTRDGVVDTCFRDTLRVEGDVNRGKSKVEIK